VTSTVEGAVGQGNRGLFRQPAPGYPIGWYAVALSDELAAGEVRRVEMCDGRIVLYRGLDGIARAMTPYCAHMGADLGVGAVVGNDIQCAFHHWQYGPDGRCTKIPSGDRIPTLAVQRTFSVEDRWGLIWVYWGDEPVYPVPSFTDWNDDEWVYRAFIVPLEEPLRVEPWVFATNVFDFQHFRVVHGLNFDPDVQWQQWSASWTADVEHPLLGEVTMAATLFGTNTVLTRSVRGEDILTHIAAITKMGDQSVIFFCVATRKCDTSDEILDQQQAFHSQIVSEDLPILNTLRLGNDHLVASDKQLAKFLRYLKNYPKTSITDLDPIH
jgi:nitrite reductase/ring-hydroxylating ferredoxin subunit